MEAEIKVKSDNYIQLKDSEDILKLKIRDEEGNDTGESLVFNLEDIELPIKYQKIIEEDKKARKNLQNQFIIIDKRQDHKGKKLLSSNEEAKIKAMQVLAIYNLLLFDLYLLMYSNLIVFHLKVFLLLFHLKTYYG